MSQAPKDTRSAAEKARDTAGIIGSLKHEGYVPTPEAEAVHQRVARGRNHERRSHRDFSRTRASARANCAGAQASATQWEEL
jgi:hypothetical protein